jgi:putative ABC transport system permease protein|tara:strand:+ start:11934 stop:13124 length:1191 start_codon:yes stop_codon:yes gene_type:complete
MEFRPIVSALRFHKTSFVLVVAQIAITLAIIVNAAFISKYLIVKVNRPTGMDIDNIIVTEVRGFGAAFDTIASMKDDMRAIRAIPGVIAATVTNHVPLSGSGSGTGLRSVPDETAVSVPTARYQMSEWGVDSLGAELIEGRSFYAEEIEYGQSRADSVIVTKALADKLYPEGDALGKPVYWTSLRPATIVGIIGHMQGAWTDWDHLNHVVIHPGVPIGDSNRYLIRTLPGERDRLLAEIEEKLAETPNRVIKSVRTHRDIVDRTYHTDKLMVGILVIVSLLLVILICLVIVGLVSYFVTERTRQIGTRRALGATRFDILRYFLMENWIITTTGAVLGSFLTVLISYVMETSLSLPRLDSTYLLISILVLWVISQAAAWFPARQATMVSPAIATRSV